MIEQTWSKVRKYVGIFGSKTPSGFLIKDPHIFSNQRLAVFDQRHRTFSNQRPGLLIKDPHIFATRLPETRGAKKHAVPSGIKITHRHQQLKCALSFVVGQP